MDKKLTLAVAGSGKTYTISNSIDSSKKNIIFTFNRKNVDNLKKEIFRRFGYIPKNTKIITFHKFRYDYIIKPAQYQLKEGGINLRGIEIIKKPPKRPNPRKGIYNTGYIKDNVLEHYLFKDKIYSDYMSKLIIKKALIKNEFIEKFIDNIYIDEFQDFEDYDFKVIKELYNLNINIYSYGDYFQAGVSHNCNMSKIPYKNVENYTNYKETLIQEIPNLNIDEISLIKSRRCGKVITDFINNNYEEEIIKSEKINENDITWLDSDEISKIEEEVVYLVWDKRSADKLNLTKYKTWSLSKGDTYKNTCIILTKKAQEFLINSKKLEKTSKNKLYVALTRATNKVYIVKI